MKRRILYADDDETSRLSIARLLEQEGYECVAAADGLVGGHFLREQEFDCGISDLNMLGNANMEFLAAVPKLQPGVPMIIVTGYPSIESATAAFQLPVVAYLTKPLDFDELLRQVHEASFRRLVLQEFNATRSNLEKWRADLGDLELDRLVQTTLNRVKNVAPFPKGVAEDQRTFVLHFQIKSKS